MVTVDATDRARGPRRRVSGGWTVARFWMVALSLVLSGCREEEAGETAGPELLRMGADQVIVGMETFLTADGVRKAHLIADTAYFHTDISEVRLRQLRVTFYDDQGLEVSELTGDDGLYHSQNGDMEASGNVVVVDRRESQRLETESLRYKAAEDRLYGDVDFTFLRGTEVHRGSRFESDPGLDAVRVTGPSGVTRGVTAPGSGRRTAVPDTGPADSGAVPVSVEDSTAADPVTVEPTPEDTLEVDPIPSETTRADSTAIDSVRAR